jgi:hypothetical protein
MPRTFYAIVISPAATVVHRFSTVAARTQFLSQLPPGHTAQAATAAHPLVRKALRYATQLESDWPIAV